LVTGAAEPSFPLNLAPAPVGGIVKTVLFVGLALLGILVLLAGLLEPDRLRLALGFLALTVFGDLAFVFLVLDLFEFVFLLPILATLIRSPK
jgi:hypothetical protein